MNKIRVCLAVAALAVAAACSDSHPVAAPKKGVHLDSAPTAVGTQPAANGGYLGSGNMAMCADSTVQLMPDGCTGRGGMLGSGT
jgi:hypothetical protein